MIILRVIYGLGYHRNHKANMDLGHLLTPSGLTRL